MTLRIKTKRLNDKKLNIIKLKKKSKMYKIMRKERSLMVQQNKENMELLRRK